MAGRDRMTIEEVVRQVLRDEHGDVIRESVRAVAQELMESEISELIGAQHGERTEDRATHRNGYRPRRWDTRAGEIELQIPKMRQGSYFPSFLQPRKRSEQALVSVVQQAYVCGVSTRRVDQPASWRLSSVRYHTLQKKTSPNAAAVGSAGKPLGDRTWRLVRNWLRAVSDIPAPVWRSSRARRSATSRASWRQPWAMRACSRMPAGSTASMDS